LSLNKVRPEADPPGKAEAGFGAFNPRKVKM
jgi:hypothetical protein